MTTEILFPDDRHLHLVDEQTEIPEQESAAEILKGLESYVMGDPKRKNVSWDQLFEGKKPLDNRPEAAEEISYKSRRHIEIDDKYRVVAEAIVLEPAARESNTLWDPHPTMMFRLTLVKPGYKVNPRRQIDPAYVYARAYVELGEEGAWRLDQGDTNLRIDRQYYSDSAMNGLQDLPQLEVNNPILSLFTAPYVRRVAETREQHAILTVDHLRTIRAAFPPYQVAPAAVPLN